MENRKSRAKALDFIFYGSMSAIGFIILYIIMFKYDLKVRRRQGGPGLVRRGYLWHKRRRNDGPRQLLQVLSRDGLRGLS